MIEVSHVYKEFIKKVDKNHKKKFFADNDISFKVDDGIVFGIIGPNGAGKTTLLRMLSGIMEPSSGSILIEKKNYKDNDIEIKKKLAFLSGNTRLYKDLSPLELLYMCGEYYGVEKNILKERINNIIRRFEMESFAHQKIDSLSTGQYQRVSIARCLVHDPKYYILDEATSGLDIITSKVIIDFILEEKSKGKCIIYSTHYMEEVVSICDRIMLLNKGKVLIEGTVKEIKSKSGKDNLRDSFFELTRRDIDEYMDYY